MTAKRSGDEWYLGAMTDGTARDLTVSLDFLSSQSDGWTVTEYADAAEADVDNNPTAVVISDYNVSAGDSVSISWARAAGPPCASSLRRQRRKRLVTSEAYVLRNATRKAQISRSPRPVTRARRSVRVSGERQSAVGRHRPRKRLLQSGSGPQRQGAG